MAIIIQLIEVFWTKESRGAPQSTIRNAIPEHYPLGSYEFGEEVYLQYVKYSEYDNFKKADVRRIRSINENQQREMRLSFQMHENTVEVLTSLELYGEERGKRIGVLKKNSWLRVVNSFRQATLSSWGYHKLTYNIFWGRPNKFDEVVSRQEPIEEVRHDNILS